MYAPKELVGKKVIIGRLKPTTGILVAERHIEARRANCSGKFMQYLPGHGGDVIAVTHAWGVGVYSIGEFRFAKPIKNRKRDLPRKAKKQQRYVYAESVENVIIGTSWSNLKKKLPPFITPGKLHRTNARELQNFLSNELPDIIAN